MKSWRLSAAVIMMAAVFMSAACPRMGTTNDNSVTRAIQAKLYQDATLKKRDISVISEKGVVVLTGQVSSEDERSAAEKVAASEDGVKQVINQLVVVGSASGGTRKGPDAPPKAP
jgi:osmotically-inducible protein OsmY